jgi:hypothetical protein
MTGAKTVNDHLADRKENQPEQNQNDEDEKEIAAKNFADARPPVKSGGRLGG